jgi:hypothetical protein
MWRYRRSVPRVAVDPTAARQDGSTSRGICPRSQLDTHSRNGRKTRLFGSSRERQDDWLIE